MKEFFQVHNLSRVMTLMREFPQLGCEEIPIGEAPGRILCQNVASESDLPDFPRATMDGYAVCATSTFGASEANPAYLSLKGTVAMAQRPGFSIGPGEAAKISTGGMLPQGADAVVMVEHTEPLDDETIEVYKSIAPGQHMIGVGEDFKKGRILVEGGVKIRPQDIGVLAAMGMETVHVFKQPVVGIISTGDEIVPIHRIPEPGQIRDINSFTLAALVEQSGGIAKCYGITEDDGDAIFRICERAQAETDMALISGGSSVGVRDFTISALTALPGATIFVHGIAISPGKPTILAKVGDKPFWGLPGHVVSAMIVFQVVVKPFLAHISGLRPDRHMDWKVPAVLARNVASAQGRTDYIRVRLVRENQTVTAEPVLGKSGLINTMVQADGLIEISENTEGLEKGTQVDVILI